MIAVKGQQHFFNTGETSPKGLKAVYRPKGRALEYSAWALNLYKGCTHGCFYCYGPGAAFRSESEYFGDPQELKDVLKNIESDRNVLRDSGHFGPVLLSFLSDPYQPAEMETELTRNVIKLLKEAEIKINILSKGGRRATRDFDLLGPDDWAGATLTFSDDEQSRTEEPQAGIPSERLEYLRMAKENGINTWASIEPVVDPFQAVNLINRSLPFTDHFKIGKLNFDTMRHGDRRERVKKIHDSIDWTAFLREAIAILEGAGFSRTRTPGEYNVRGYYIKQDTVRFL